MNKGRVGEKRGGKEMDGCPLTDAVTLQEVSSTTTPALPPPKLLKSSAL
jgi:hypothetical protein